MRRIVLVLAMATTSVVAADRHIGPVTKIVVAGDKVYSCSQAGVMAGTGEGLRLLVQSDLRITALAALSEGLILGGGTPGEFGALGWTRISRGTPHPKMVRMGEDLINDLASLPEGSFVLARTDGQIHLGSFSGGGKEQTVMIHRHTAAARAVAVSPDGRWIASGGLDGVIILSELRDGKPGKPQSLLEHTSGVECLVFSPDSKFIASGSLDSKVRIHRVSGKLVRTYKGLGMEDEPVAGRVVARVLSLAWKERLVAGTSKGTLHELSQKDDKVKRLARKGVAPIYSLAIDADGALLLGGQGKLEVRPR